MSTPKPKISAVPTHVITGFLGAGKTSTIVHLLRHKPAAERWAVLVNEFGEVGVDGSLLEGHTGAGQAVFVHEVPGGCMCCAAGLPMQIALNQLLRRARPQRLLIEPTGLGHPAEVLQTLSSNHNAQTLALQKTVTLVDARNLADPRYRDHDSFRQQLAVADLVVANKQDLYTEADRRALQRFSASVCREGVELLFTQNGEIPLERLYGAAAALPGPAELHTHQRTEALLAQELPFPPSGYITAVNQGEGYESIGWRFSPEKVFERQRLFAFLSGLAVERMKAVFITSDGIYGYNLTRDALTETALDEVVESRIEIISEHIEAAWSERLIACLVAG